MIFSFVYCTKVTAAGLNRVYEMAPSLLCPDSTHCPDWYVIAVVTLASGVLFVLADWAWSFYTGGDGEAKAAAAEPAGSFPDKAPRFCGFVHVSASTMSGKGWSTNPTEALKKLVTLASKPLPNGHAVSNRATLSNVRRNVLAKADATRFAQCGRIYISGDDRDATRRAVARLVPNAHIVLV